MVSHDYVCICGYYGVCYPHYTVLENKCTYVWCGRTGGRCYGCKLFCGALKPLLYVHGAIYYCRTYRYLATDIAQTYTRPGNCRFPAWFYGLVSICMGRYHNLIQISLSPFSFRIFYLHLRYQ